MAAWQLTDDDGEDDGLILDTPDMPSDLSYAGFEDFRARELLKVNGFSLTEEALLSVLEDEEGVFKSAAARTLANLGSTAAIPALERLAAGEGDLVKVDAAYALVRLGVAEQRDTLRACLDYPVNAYLCPSVAAGYLARLGDPEGLPVIARCFETDNLIVRMVACKQLYFFVPFQGVPGGDGQPLDVFDLFDRALHDQDIDVQETALVQLREFWTPEAQSVLEAYVAEVQDEGLREEAQYILDSIARDTAK